MYKKEKLHFEMTFSMPSPSSLLKLPIMNNPSFSAASGSSYFRNQDWALTETGNTFHKKQNSVNVFQFLGAGENQALVIFTFALQIINSESSFSQRWRVQPPTRKKGECFGPIRMSQVSQN